MLAEWFIPAKFPDVETEREFLRTFRVSGMTFTRACLLIASLMIVGFVAAVALRSDLLGSDLQRQLIRVALAVILGGAWFFAGKFRHFIERNYVLAVGGVIGLASLALSVLAAAPLLPEISDPFPSKIPMAVIIVLWLSYTFPRLPTFLVSALTATPTLVAIFVAWGQPQDFPIAVILYLIAAHSIGVVLGIQVERRERAVFAHALELERANAKIAAQAKHNQELSEAKSLVLASVSHDLRQPLSSLALYVNMLRAEADHPETTEIVRCADHMQTCVGAMEGNLSRILEISKAQTLGTGFPVSSVDLANVFARLRTIFAPAATATGIELKFQALAPGVLMVKSNPERLHEVLSNLLSNAIKFANHDRRAGCWAYIGVIKTAGGLRIDVRDNGIGIPIEHQDRVFNEYYQVGNPARKSTHGYGLGLSMVRSTIGRLPGHSLAMYSRPGKGSRFSVYAPQAPASSQAALKKPASEPAVSADGELLVGSMVLIVEDDDSLRNALSDQLISWGAVVEAAESCDEALEIARSCERLIDVVISDFKLPGEKNGIDVIRQVRATQPHLVAALIISGEYSFDRNLLKGIEAVRFLPKPIAPETLRAELTMAIKSSLASAAQLN